MLLKHPHRRHLIDQSVTNLTNNEPILSGLIYYRCVWNKTSLCHQDKVSVQSFVAIFHFVTLIKWHCLQGKAIIWSYKIIVPLDKTMDLYTEQRHRASG